MRIAWRILIFIAAFQMEVRVRASADLLQQPEACINTQELCSLRANRQAFHYQDQNTKLHLKAKSSAEKIAAHQWRLTSGTVWVEKATDFKLETLFAEMESKRGQFWVFVENEKVSVRNVDADLVIHFRDGKSLPLPAGFEFWVSGINSLGQTEYGMIEAVDLRKHILDWGPLFTGTVAQFRGAVEKLKENWGPLAVKGGNLYQEVTDRKLASIAEEKRQQDLRRQRILIDDQKVRRLYMQKVFER